MFISGADEAGRGPVIGPLVICLATIDVAQEKELVELGVDDSKKLSPSTRKELFPKIEKLCEYQLRVLSASELNERMAKESLNEIEARAIGELASSVSGRIYVDLPEKYPNGFLRKAGLLGRDVIAEHKADSKYPIVGAASILAKVTRDRIVAELAAEVGEIGSGYPADERTINALRDPKMRKKLKGHIREKWSTLERVLQPKLTDF
ncbi:MAG: ribonuclease HII [Candidatus Bilamarchaeaceae archaeon]